MSSSEGSHTLYGSLRTERPLNWIHPWIQLVWSNRLALIDTKISCGVQDIFLQWGGAFYVTATLALTSAKCQRHMSSVWPWSGMPKVRLYYTFLGGLRQAGRFLASLSVLSSSSPSESTREGNVQGTINNQYKIQERYCDFTCFALPCTSVLGLKVEWCCKVSEFTTEIPDVTMLKILQSDVLDIQVGGVADVNVTYSDEVGEVFLFRFTPVLALTFGLGGIGGGGEWGCGCVCCGCGWWLWLWRWCAKVSFF